MTMPNLMPFTNSDNVTILIDRRAYLNHEIERMWIHLPSGRDYAVFAVRRASEMNWKQRRVDPRDRRVLAWLQDNHPSPMISRTELVDAWTSSQELAA